MMKEYRGTYNRQEPHQLKGERATLRIYADNSRCLAQFDNAATGHVGWYTFELADFDLDRPEAAD